MKNKFALAFLITIAGTILFGSAPITAQASGPKPANNSKPSSSSASINESTVLILVQSNTSFKDMSLGHGIGTLIEHKGEHYLVTHNHWGNILDEDLATVELRDAQNKLIKPMFASAFKELIVHQDPGTLVLQAIPELVERLKPAQIETSPTLKEGTVVQVAYRQLPNRVSLTVLDAKVVRTSTFEGEAIYEIRSTDGQGLQKGDSGGGVWHNGKLVGNTWAIVVEKGAANTTSQSEGNVQVASGESYTAILPEFFK